MKSKEDNLPLLLLPLMLLASLKMLRQHSCWDWVEEIKDFYSKNYPGANSWDMQ